jgi:hypothetical protein
VKASGNAGAFFFFHSPRLDSTDCERLTYDTFQSAPLDEYGATCTFPDTKVLP